MPSHAEFIATICKHPADMGPRLVYADWLEERGDVRGEYIRLAIELAEYDATYHRGNKYLPCGCEWNVGHNNDCTWRGRNVRGLCADMIIKHGFEWFRETFDGLDFGWRGEAMRDDFSFSMCHGREVTGPLYNCRFNKGFIESIELSFSDWQRHYQTLIDAMPVRKVRLTTRPLSHHSDPRLIKTEVLDRLITEFPGHDPAHPIRYTLPAATQSTGMHGTEGTGHGTPIGGYPAVDFQPLFATR